MVTRRKAKTAVLDAQDEQKKLLKLLPEGAQRIQVRNSSGKLKYRPLDELTVTDVIQIKKDGAPIVTMRTPGRKAKPYEGPVNDEVAAAIERKDRSLSEDAILQAIKGTPESTEVLHHTMIGLAEEAGSIAFERQEAERKGKETSTLSVRRIKALKAVVDTWLRRKEQVSDHSIDLDSPGFHKLFAFIMETFRGTMGDVELHPDLIKVVFARFSKRVSGEEWQAEAKGRMRAGI